MINGINSHTNFKGTYVPISSIEELPKYLNAVKYNCFGGFRTIGSNVDKYDIPKMLDNCQAGVQLVFKDNQFKGINVFGREKETDAATRNALRAINKKVKKVLQSYLKLPVVDLKASVVNGEIVPNKKAFEIFVSNLSSDEKQKLMNSLQHSENSDLRLIG